MQPTNKKSASTLTQVNRRSLDKVVVPERMKRDYSVHVESGKLVIRLKR